MDSPFSSLIFLVSGFSITIFALLVQSLPQGEVSLLKSPPSVAPPPPPPSLPLPAPPPPHRRPSNLNQNSTPVHRRHKNHRQRKLPTPPPAKQKLNLGKKIGVAFAGVAAIMQIGVVGFVVFKTRQLVRMKDKHENRS